MNGKYNHARLDAVEHTGIFEVFVTGMNVTQSATYFDLGRENKTLEIKIKTQAGFYTKIGFLQLDQVFGFTSLCVGSQVIIDLSAAEHIHTEIANTVAVKLYLNGQRNYHRLYFLHHITAQLTVGIAQLVSNAAVRKLQFRVKPAFKAVAQVHG